MHEVSKSCGDVLICECTSIWGDPIDAHTRNSLAMAKDLGCDIVGGTCTDNMRVEIPSSYVHCLKKSYNAIVFPYGSHYINYFHYPRFIRANPHAQLFWLINEYNSTHPFSFLKKQCNILTDEIVMVTNVDNDPRVDRFQATVRINLNLLLARKPNALVKKNYNIAYYGTFRPNREPYFRTYLRDGLVVSCSPKNLTKFHAIGCTSKFIGKMHWPAGRETLNNFRFSLYIEDDFTHDNYNYLANRFYEALFCNCVLMFDRTCANTIRKSGITVHDDFLVSDYSELIGKTTTLAKDLPAALERQQSAWLPQVFRERDAMLVEFADVLHRTYPQTPRPKRDRTEIYASPIHVGEVMRARRQRKTQSV
jgi:hypothetical protein